MPPTLEQLRLLQILQIPSAILSIVGSATIIGIILRKRRKRLKQTYYRIMLGLSVSDVILSSSIALSSVPAPRGMGMLGLGAAFARGTIQTCTAQGFLVVFGSTGVVFYTSSLAIYYLLVVVLGKSRRWIATRAERYLHAVPITVALVLAIINLPLEMYNFSGSTCWVNLAPLGCSDNPNFPCQRGRIAGVLEVYVYRWIVFGWQILLALTITTVCMLVIWWHVWKTEKRMRNRYDFEFKSRHLASVTMDTTQRTGDSQQDNFQQKRERAKMSRTRQVAIQALLYISALIICWIWRYIFAIQLTRKGEVDFPLLAIERILQPLQGFFNLVIFLRVYNKNRGNQPEAASQSLNPHSSHVNSLAFQINRSRHRLSLSITSHTNVSKTNESNETSACPTEKLEEDLASDGAEEDDGSTGSEDVEVGGAQGDETTSPV